MVAALLVTFLGGWLWGGVTGRRETLRAIRIAEAGRSLSEARASLLGARVSLDDADLVGVTRGLGRARAFVAQARAGLPVRSSFEDRGRQDLAEVLAGIDDAQRLVDAAVQRSAVARPSSPLLPEPGR